MASKTTAKTKDVNKVNKAANVGRSTRKSAKGKNYAERSDTESELDVEPEPEPLLKYAAPKNEVVEAAETKPVFETFSTDKALAEGLCIIRSLGCGTYEILSLKDASCNVLGSEKTGRMIKEIPGRFEMVDMSEEDWKVAKFNCDQAKSSASKTHHNLESQLSTSRPTGVNILPLSERAVLKSCCR